VDDDDDERELMQLALERKGYDVVAVESGAEALGFVACDTPSLIVLDLEMDDMNGWEVLVALEGHPRFSSFRVVVVSGATATVPTWADYIRKPFRIDALIELLEAPKHPTA
jgi:CheY-like chemotaxis protein